MNFQKGRLQAIAFRECRTVLDVCEASASEKGFMDDGAKFGDVCFISFYLERFVSHLPR